MAIEPYKVAVAQAAPVFMQLDATVDQGIALCEPLPDNAEGILYADIDLGAIPIAKCFADPVGHTARSSVTQLLPNRSAMPPVQFTDVMPGLVGDGAADPIVITDEE
ncbi:MAG: hypothetical protein ACU85U_06625 [Gammaproteobacteria bacterium]|jgi:hypothetical protein